jgi:hypothetical protein
MRTRGLTSGTERGPIVARERPTSSNAVPPADANPERTRLGDPAGLTRAEARALRRSTPLTPAQFKILRRRAEQGLNPLRQPEARATDQEHARAGDLGPAAGRLRRSPVRGPRRRPPRPRGTVVASRTAGSRSAPARSDPWRGGISNPRIKPFCRDIAEPRRGRRKKLRSPTNRRTP